MKSVITSIVLALTISFTLQGQSANFRVLDKSTMKIDGTSNIHDWTCDVEQIQSTIRYNPAALQGDHGGSPVESLSLTIPVNKIESGKGGMNKKMYDALKMEEHPNITFRLTNSELSNFNASSGNYSLDVQGRLTIAGVTKTVSIPVSAKRVNGGTYQFSGSYEINMTDYDVEPPSALFGTVSAGEMVSVGFDMYVSSQ